VTEELLPHENTVMPLWQEALYFVVGLVFTSVFAVTVLFSGLTIWQAFLSFAGILYVVTQARRVWRR